MIAIVFSMFIAGTAQAAQSRTARQSADSARKGPVKKLIELEKRKNEWLREKMGR